MWRTVRQPVLRRARLINTALSSHCVSCAFAWPLCRDPSLGFSLCCEFLKPLAKFSLAADPPLACQRLTLARRPLIRGDGVPLVDLRPLGAPVAPYACKVHRLHVNGREVPLSRPTVAVIDTGTTGLVISDSIYDSDELPLPGAAIRRVVVDVLTERGRVFSFKASAASSQSGASSSSPPSDFPFIVTPVALSWFEEADVFYRRRTARQPAYLQAASSELGRAPHVLFLGLAFMSDLRLKIDIDTQRLSAERPSFGRVNSR